MGMTAEEMRVASGALEGEADKWDDEAPGLDSIHESLEGMALTRVEAGLFQIMFNAYESCRSTVAGRAEEGAKEFRLMATTLRHIAKDYARTDEAEADEYASRAW